MSATANLHSTPQDARLEFRVPSELKALLEQAATLSGFSSTKDFIVAHAMPAAQAVIASHSDLKLNAADSRFFVTALLNPRPLSHRMKRMQKRHQELVMAR